jgi:oxygen-independent coproporphyrinogen-3 oxidase
MDAQLLQTRRRELLDAYGVRAPRYTSYPTAVQFTPKVDAATYRRWLSALPADELLSLYVHVPFCRRLCWYCGCNTRVVNGQTAISRYVARLGDELALVGAQLPARMAASQIALGGGTPNTLSVEDLGALFAALRERFAVAADAQISAEIDPVVFNRPWAEAAVALGLNRASLGVQDLTPEVQKAVNRNEPFSVIVEAVRVLRDLGVPSVNFDVMYGLPRQGVADVLSTLDQLITLRPDRLALFGYAHVPWMKSHQKLISDAELPDAVERLDQSEASGERLTAAGYVRIGLDHFALPEDPLAKAAAAGGLMRNFQGYNAAGPQTLLGFGASAISQLRQGIVQNITPELGWTQALDRGELPVARGVALTPEDRLRGEVIERLMCDFAVDLDETTCAHGFPADSLADAGEALETLERDGVIRRHGARIEVTALGRPYVRAVCAAFDAYLEPGARRHALAV